MNRTPSTVIFEAGREAVRQLVALDPDDTVGAAMVIATVASDYGLSVQALEDEIRDRTEDDYADEHGDAEVDPDYLRDDPEPTYGPARLHDDGYYARNDAGEYHWM